MKPALAVLSALLAVAALLLGLDSVRATDPLPQAIRPSQSRSAPLSGCTARVSETVSPVSLRLCETAEVTVTANVTCPTSLPVHLVIAIDRSLSMEEYLPQIRRSARGVLEAIDFADPNTKVGVLSHGFEVTVETELTNVQSRALGAINGVGYHSGDIGEDPAKAIEKAQQMLEHDREGISPIEVILAYGDGCDETVPRCPAESRRASAAADGAGIRVVAVCYAESGRANCRDYRQMASSPAYYYEAPAGRLPQAIGDFREEGATLSVDELRLLEVLGSRIALVPGSGGPRPVIDGPRLTFAWEDLLPGGAATATYRIRGTEIGKLQVRQAESAFTIVDSLERESAPIPISTAYITITGPCVTPSPSSPPPPTATQLATSTPTTRPTTVATPSPVPSQQASPTATMVTSEPVRAFLPVALRGACRLENVHTDVVLVIDASSSMSEASGPSSKLAAAQQAARQFVGLLDLAHDQAAVVAFNSNARVAVPLTSNRAALEAVLSDIQLAVGTRIDLALEAAGTELSSQRAKPSNNKVVVLLTDGLPSEGTSSASLRAAGELRSAQIVVYAIGLGADVDRGLLQAIAWDRKTYVEAPTAEDLERIYEEIAGELPCPGGAIWMGQ